MKAISFSLQWSKYFLLIVMHFTDKIQRSPSFATTLTINKKWSEKRGGLRSTVHTHANTKGMGFFWGEGGVLRGEGGRSLYQGGFSLGLIKD